MDLLQWMGAVRMRVQTADKNITSNPHDSSPPFNVFWIEKLHACKKSCSTFSANFHFVVKSRDSMLDSATSKIIY